MYKNVGMTPYQKLVIHEGPVRYRSESIFCNPQNRDVGRGLRKIVTYSHSYLAGHSVSLVFGTVSSLHPFL